MLTQQRLKIYKRVIERLGGVSADGTKLKPEDIDLVFMAQFDLITKMMDDPEVKSIILPGLGVWTLRRRVKHARPEFYKLTEEERDNMDFTALCRLSYGSLEERREREANEKS
jgi:hypothetical protein